MEDKKDILKRVFLVFALILLFALAIIIKIIYIQIAEGPDLILKSQKHVLKYFDIDAARGNIYADNEDLLATSIPIFDIRMDVNSKNISDKYFIKKIDSLAYCLSHLFKNKTPYQYKRDLKQARKNNNRYYLIKRNITYSQLKKIRIKTSLL